MRKLFSLFKIKQTKKTKSKEIKKNNLLAKNKQLKHLLFNYIKETNSILLFKQ